MNINFGILSDILEAADKWSIVSYCMTSIFWNDVEVQHWGRQRERIDGKGQTRGEGRKEEKVYGGSTEHGRGRK